jgi:hypothetical protein
LSQIKDKIIKSQILDTKIIDDEEKGTGLLIKFKVSEIESISLFFQDYDEIFNILQSTESKNTSDLKGKDCWLKVNEDGGWIASFKNRKYSKDEKQNSFTKILEKLGLVKIN